MDIVIKKLAPETIEKDDPPLRTVVSVDLIDNHTIRSAAALKLLRVTEEIMCFAMPSMSVYIGGLGEDTQKEDLEREFSRFGNITKVWVARNPPGFAFIDFENDDDADEAIKEMNGATINGYEIRVDASRGGIKRGQGRGRGDGGFRGGRGGGGFRGGRDGGFSRGGGGGRGFSRGGPRYGGGGGGYDSGSGYRSGGGGGYDSGSGYRSGGGGGYDSGSGYRSRSPVGQRNDRW